MDHRLLLVLSIAVLVLVPDCGVRGSIRPLDQSSQHRHDAPPLRLALMFSGMDCDARSHWSGTWRFIPDSDHAIDGQSIPVALLVIEDRFAHRSPFEDEYRSAEHEYEDFIARTMDQTPAVESQVGTDDSGTTVAAAA